MTLSSVAIKRAMHDMRKRGIPLKLVNWMERRYEGRTTVPSFDGPTSEPINVLTGLDQGDPNSGNVYIFYNADLLEIPNPKEGEHAPLFVDDATTIAQGKTFTKPKHATNSVA